MKDLSALRGAAVNGRIRMQTQNDYLGPVSLHMAPSLKWEGEGRWEREKDKVARSVKQPRMSGTQRKPCFTELHMQLPRALNCDQRKQSNRMKLVPDMRVCSGNSKLTVIYIWHTASWTNHSQVRASSHLSIYHTINRMNQGNNTNDMGIQHNSAEEFLCIVAFLMIKHR